MSLHTFVIQGVLNGHELVTMLPEEIFKSCSEISVLNVMYTTPPGSLADFVHICCNVVSSKKFVNNRIEIFNPPIAFFLFDADNGGKNPKVSKDMNPLWFKFDHSEARRISLTFSRPNANITGDNPFINNYSYIYVLLGLK